MKKLTTFVILFLVVTSPALVLAQDSGADVVSKISYAMRAAPARIAQDATILDWSFDENGDFVVLRAGTNGWSCLPGNPKPMCLDAVFMEWLYSLVAGEDLIVTEPGVTYMLRGGEALSNSDPGATEPAEDYWLSSDPYMMVLLPTGTDLTGISTDIDSPSFIMYADSPYQHIMVPLGDMADLQSRATVVGRISATDAYAVAQNGSAIFIDVRGQVSFDISHIPGAFSNSVIAFADQLGEIPKDQLIISYCN